MDRRRPDDDRGCACLWRAGRDDAAGGRTVCLSARGIRPALGVSVRMDAAAGDPDRHYRSGRGSFCAFRRCDVAGPGLGLVDRRGRLWNLGRAAGRDRGYRAANCRKSARPRSRQVGAEFVHDREDSVAAADRRRRMHSVPEPCRREGELRQCARIFFLRNDARRFPGGIWRRDGRELCFPPTPGRR